MPVIYIVRMNKMQRPIIGVSCNLRPNEAENGNFNLDRSYTDAVYQAGGMPQIIPILPEDEIEDLLDLYDGILLSGGGGLLPEIKRMKTLPGLKEQNPIRYAFELKLIQAAFRRRIPIMGVCRGHQMINAALGGMVVNLSTKKHRQDNPSVEASHPVEVKQNTILYDAVLSENMGVNSFHSQVIDKLGAELRVTARSGEGYIEAIEGTGDHLVLGVQFHPEFMIDNKAMLNIYKVFIQAASK